MRGHFEFSFHIVSEANALLGDVDPSLALLGSQGWEMCAMTVLANGSISVALQRCTDEEHPIADAPALSARLAEPLAVPTAEQLEREAAG